MQNFHWNVWRKFYAKKRVYVVSRWKFALKKILSTGRNESGTACCPQIANDPV